MYLCVWLSNSLEIGLHVISETARTSLFQLDHFDQKKRNDFSFQAEAKEFSFILIFQKNLPTQKHPFQSKAEIRRPRLEADHLPSLIPSVMFFVSWSLFDYMDRNLHVVFSFIMRSKRKRGCIVTWNYKDHVWTPLNCVLPLFLLSFSRNK